MTMRLENNTSGIETKVASEQHELNDGFAKARAAAYEKFKPMAEAAIANARAGIKKTVSKN